MTINKREQTIQSEIRLALSEHGVVFRTNSGTFWQGKTVHSKEHGQNVLINIRRVQGLPEGFSDLLFVGQDRVAFIEVKKPGQKPKPGQVNFLNRMAKLGHIAIVAYSAEGALELIK